MTKHSGSVENLQQTTTEVTLGDDLLRDADEIARFMFWRREALPQDLLPDR